jgi:hypothetical protein
VQSIVEPLQALLDGTVRSMEFSGGQIIVDAPRRGRVYLPGSFNPLHDGHRCGLTWDMRCQLLTMVLALGCSATGQCSFQGTAGGCTEGEGDQC